MGSPEVKLAITAQYGQADQAFKSAAQSAADFNARLKSALASYNETAKSSREIQLALGKAFDTAAASGKGYVDALETAVAATRQLQAAEEQEKLALDAGRGARSRATEAMYVLQGSSFGAARAIGDFASRLPGFGALINNVFSAFVVVAFAEEIYRAGQAMAEAFDIGNAGAYKLQNDLAKLNDSYRTLVDSTELETAKLQAQDAKLEGRPNPNGLQLSILEALDAADKLSQKLDELIGKQRTLLTTEIAKGGYQPTTLRSFLAGTTGTRQEQVILSEHEKHLDNAKNIQDQLNESTSYGVVLHQRLNDLVKKQVEIQQAYQAAGNVPGGQAALEVLGTRDYSKEIAATQELIQSQQKEHESIQATIDLQKEQATHAKVVAAHGHKAPKENYADELAAQQVAHGKSLGETVLYWQRVVAETGKYHSELLRAEEAFQKEIVAKQKLVFASTGAEPGAPTAGIAASLSGYQSPKQIAEQKRVQEELLRGQEQQIENAARLREAQIAAAERSGGISKSTADQERGKIVAEEYARQIAALQKQLASLDKTSADYVRTQNQINNLQGKAKIAGIASQSATAADLASPYLKATDMINQAWLGMQNKLIFGTRNVAQAFANMGVSMLQAVATSFEKMMVRQLQYEIQSRIAHQITNQAKLASDQSAAVAGQIIHRESALKQEFVDAKAAAVAAFKGVMQLVPPPLNFILAPVAAGAAFAGALAVGAFEKGGIIPNTGLALVHEGEGVMPRNLTNLLNSVANDNRRTSNTSTSITSNTSFHGINDRSFRDLARRNSAAVADAVGREMRSGRRR